MRIEFDRSTCIGMYQCVDEWEAFVKDMDRGKAELIGSTESNDRDEIFVLDVPPEAEFDAEMAARVCPVDAIAFFDDDGTKIVP